VRSTGEGDREEVSFNVSGARRKLGEPSILLYDTIVTNSHSIENMKGGALRECHLLQVREEVALEDGRRRENAARTVYYYLVDFIRVSYTLVHLRTLEWFEGVQAFCNEFLLERFYDYAVLRPKALKEVLH
jgi:hypothetical protein